jgi:hypothetical protein
MQSSARQIANAQNAQLSTGPVTQEGKNRIRLNATRHGLTSKTLIIKGESVEEFEAMKTGFLRDYAPANDVERAMAERVAENYWRLQRLYRAEAGFFDAMMNETMGSIGEMFANTSATGRTNLFLRYLTAAERAYNRSLADLRIAQAERKAAEEAEAPESVNSMEKAWLAALEAPIPGADGFVSQMPQLVAKE